MRTTMPATLALLALTGVGAGFYFGGEAAGEIDPFYYTTPWDTRGPSYAALVPHTPSGAPEVVDHAADPVMVPFRGYGTVRVAPRQGDELAEAYATAMRIPADVPETLDIPEPDPELAAALEEEMQRIERYASYPVSQDELRTGHSLAISAVLEDEPEPALEAETPEYPEPVAED